MIAYLNGRKIRNLNVDGEGVILAPGTKFSHSTWEEFPSQYVDVINSNRDWSNMFNTCLYLNKIDVSKFDSSNVTDMNHMFNGCSQMPSYLLDFSNWDTSKVTNMSYMFSNCYNLRTLDITNWNTSNVTTMTNMLQRANPPKIIGKIDVSSIKQNVSNSYFTGSYNNTGTTYLTFSNIGKYDLQTSFDVSKYQKWCVNSDEVPDARQSLIDSLITNSYDRASAGYNALTITLYKNVKAVLTEDEIAQITAKGLTIA